MDPLRVSVDVRTEKGEEGGRVGECILDVKIVVTYLIVPQNVERHFGRPAEMVPLHNIPSPLKSLRQ